MIERANGRTTVPQIFIGGRHIGGCNELVALDREGKLDELLGRMTRIALLQSTTGIDPAASAETLVGAIGEAATGGATMLFTPEMSGLLDRNSERASANLRGEDDDIVLAACRAAAREHDVWVHLGSLAILADEGKVANRGFVIDRTGRVQARYDKIHLFDVDLPTGESWRESAVYRAGDSRGAGNGTPVGKLGLTICYDLRFPGCSRGSPKLART